MPGSAATPRTPNGSTASAAAVNERDVASDLLDTSLPPRDLLLDKGFTGKAFAAGQADRGTAVLLPPAKASATACPRSCGRSSPSGVTGSRPPSKEITDQGELARHGAHTF
jgi:hypothetical protein